MTIKLIHSKTLLIIPILLAIATILSTSVFQLVALAISIVLVILMFTQAKIVFEKSHLYINFGLYGRHIKYGDFEKIEKDGHIKLWQSGMKSPWELRMKDDDKNAFITALRKHNPKIVGK